MLRSFRSLTCYTITRGPEGAQREFTLWWQPGGLEPGAWWLRIGGGSTWTSNQDTILTMLSRKLSLTADDLKTLRAEMSAIETQEGIR